MGTAKSKSEIAALKATEAMKSNRIHELVRLGMDQFKENKVEESINTFDEIIALDDSRRPHLWQRGLSLYYVGRYAEASEQFRVDVAVNPNDTEESIWAFLSDCHLVGFAKARENMLVVGRDSRAVMRCAYELFRGDGSIEALQVATAADAHDQFYGELYQALFYEASGDVVSSHVHLKAALDTAYATQSDDYMVHLAIIHAQRRNFEST